MMKIALAQIKTSPKWQENLEKILKLLNETKKQEALKLGVSSFYTNTEKTKEKFDLIISTIPTYYDISTYMKLLKIGGELCIVGLPPHEVAPKLTILNLIHNAKKVYGSLIGGIKETQEMLDFSIKNEIYPEIELIKPEQIDEAYKKLTNGEAKFRYVIDMEAK